MEYNKAIDILGLPQQYTESQLKKNFHLRALQYHPDKCSGDEEERLKSTERFREVHEAYKFLTDTWSSPHERPEKNGYMHTLMECLKLFNVTVDLGQARRLITMLEDKCHSMSLQVLNEMSLATIMELYRFLMQHQTKLGISTNMLLKIESILQEKTDENSVTVVHVQIDNLMNKEMYILKRVNGDKYIPLWHPITYIKDEQCKEEIVLCVPVLPANVTLDDKNDVHVTVSLQLSELLDVCDFKVMIGGKTKIIPTSDLRIVKHQQIVLCGEGIPRPKTKLGQHIATSDIIVHVECH